MVSWAAVIEDVGDVIVEVGYLASLHAALLGMLGAV